MSSHLNRSVNPTRDVRTSFARVPVFALSDSRLSHVAFRLYAVFIDTVNEGDPEQRIWLSRANMARRCGLAARSTDGIDKALNELLKAGYIYVIDSTFGKTKTYGLVSVNDIVLDTARDLTSGTERDFTSPPNVESRHLGNVKSRHNQEPFTKNPDLKPLDQEPVNYYSDPESLHGGSPQKRSEGVKAESKDAPKVGTNSVGWITTSKGRKRVNRTDNRIMKLMSEFVEDYRPDWSGDETAQVHSEWHTILYAGMTDSVLRNGWSNDRWRVFLSDVVESGNWDRLDECLTGDGAPGYPSVSAGGSVPSPWRTGLYAGGPVDWITGQAV